MFIRNYGCIYLVVGEMGYMVYIYMNVYLFGLSPWRTNLMNPAIEFMQLVLSISAYNTLFGASLHAYFLV